ncbi:MAG: homocysteine S-methyltransferase family protein [Bacteroidota bacterium]|nr:homocysteine S-methyltransferase family protein [Bacteroidota bacterium]
MNTNKTIKEILNKRIMIIDGAMGTMIQKYHLSEEQYRGERFKDIEQLVKGNNDLLCLTQPHIISEIHKQFLEAGADIIETNTFNAQSISMEDYKMKDLVYEINLEAAKIAKLAAQEYTDINPDKPRFVAGAVGPTNRTASLSPDVNNPGFRAVTFNDLCVAYTEQVLALLEGGVDLLLVETIFDTLNAKAALFAINTIKEEKGIDIPVMVSGTITDASGRTLSGQTPEAFWNSLSHANILSIGLNCALGAKDMMPHISDISKVSWVYTTAYPNAGLPNEFGQYDESPEAMANVVEEFMKEGWVNMIGGCCGTTPEHIKAIADKAKKYAPREVPELALN